MRIGATNSDDRPDLTNPGDLVITASRKEVEHIIQSLLFMGTQYYNNATYKKLGSLLDEFLLELDGK